MNSPLTLRVLTTADIPAAQRLRALAGWNQTDDDWRNLLAFEPEGCFAAELNGELIGTATTTRYGKKLGWIGMVLVDPARRRFGIGTALLKQCIDFLDASGVRTIKLDATPLGKKVYDALGFRDEFGLERWEGSLHPPAITVGLCSLKRFERDLGAVSRFDAPVFGANRRRVIAAWRDCWPECSAVARIGKQVAGYALARRGSSFCQIGPIVGETPEICEVLLYGIANSPLWNPVVIDVVSGNAWAKALVQRLGLRLQRPLTRMVRGPNASPGQPCKILAICCPEIG